MKIWVLAAEKGIATGMELAVLEILTPTQKLTSLFPTEVLTIAVELEGIAVLLRSEVRNFELEDDIERLCKVLDREQLQLSQVVSALVGARMAANASASGVRSTRIKRGLKMALEQRWKRWEESFHEQSASEPHHVFIETGDKRRGVYEGGKLIGFLESSERGGRAYRLRNPVNVPLKGSYNTVEAAVEQLRLELVKSRRDRRQQM